MKFDPTLRCCKPTFERIKAIPKNNVQKSIPLVLLIWFVVFTIGQILELMAIAGMKRSTEDTLLLLYLTIFETLAILLFCVGVEKRTFRSLGFTKKLAVPHYLIGVVLGVAMLGGSVLIAKLCGALSFQGIEQNIAWGTLAAYLGGWLLQGLSEEVVCRSYLLCDVGTHHKPWTAIVVSALAFMALHLGNPNTSIVAFLNLFLFGVFAALLFLRTDSIWMVAAVHSLWNCAQGNIFGVEVSGMEIEAAIMRFLPVEGKDLISGGAFGMEGGLGVTAVMLLGIAVLLFDYRKNAETVSAAENAAAEA